MSESAGIYIHIPYCKQICPYCDFNVYPQQGADWSSFGLALVEELRARAPLLAHKSISSIYFGGGTPSLAPLDLLEEALTTIRQEYDVEKNPEITLEIDPGTASQEKCRSFLQLGINRVSLGWQSMRANHLKVLGRSHMPEDNEHTLVSLRKLGFENISCDLIFALPQQSPVEVQEDLDRLLEFNPEHISLYALTYHEGTPFHRWKNSGRLKPCPEEIELLMMREIKSKLENNAYEHYEVSNYGRNGFRSVHNQHYWHGRSYLGVGPGAESFLKQDKFSGARWQAIKEPSSYIHAWTEVQVDSSYPSTKDISLNWFEELGPRELWNEKILSGVRLREEFDVGEFATFLDKEKFYQAHAQASALGWIKQGPNRFCVSELGREQADSLAELFIDLVP